MGIHSMLIGRERELETLEARIDAVHHRGGGLVLRGSAGIGKSSLLGAAKELALDQGFQVLSATGVESESRMPFAALHLLLHPVLKEAGGLAHDQRQTLDAAFGKGAEATPAPFLLALAVLHLLCESAEQRPILVVVDDVQWFDHSSADALAFVARRLDSDAVILLAAIREGFDSVLLRAGLPELRIEGLPRASAEMLLDASAPDLTPAVRERVLNDAAGNPLALVELPVALQTAVRDPAYAPPAWLPLTERLEKAFAIRSTTLSADACTLLRIASADENTGLVELRRAASQVAGHDVDLSAVSELVETGLVALDGAQLRFRHPLMRSAICASIPAIERSAIHAALAEETSDHYRKTWHQAAAVVGTDEATASGLQEAGEQAQRRGATSVALAALERAAELSEDPTLRGARLVRAAELAHELGHHSELVRLLRAAEQIRLEPLDRTRLAWLREVIEDGAWSGASRVAAFVEIADRMRRSGDVDRALDALLAVALRCWWSNPDPEIGELMVGAAEKIRIPANDPRLLSILGLADPVHSGAAVLDRLEAVPPDPDLDPEAAHHLAFAASAVGAMVETDRYHEISNAGLRAQGRLGVLVHDLVSRAWTSIHLGRWQQASLAAAEAERLADETIQPRWVVVARLAAAAVAGYQGDRAKAEAVASEAEQLFLATGADPMLALVLLVRGVAALADGRGAEACEYLLRVFDPDDRAHNVMLRSWVLIDLAEAATLAGREDEALAIVRTLEPVAAESRSPHLLAGLDYARLVLSADQHSATSFGRNPGTRFADWVFTRARVELAHGVWLRRQRRIAESRVPLRAARDTFDALGAAPWGERARQELRASGEVSRSQAARPWDRLSPQELQIAEMAASGLTNKEIGNQLYLSHRTVGSHLYRIFPKLGITARSQLRGALESRSAQG